MGKVGAAALITGCREIGGLTLDSFGERGRSKAAGAGKKEEEEVAVDKDGGAMDEG